MLTLPTLPTPPTSTTPAGWKPAVPVPTQAGRDAGGTSASALEAMYLALETGAFPGAEVLAGLPAGAERSCWGCLYGSLEALPWSEIPHPLDSSPTVAPPALPFAPELIASLGAEGALRRLRRFTLLETRLTIEALEGLRLEGVSAARLAVFQAHTVRLGQLYQAWALQAGAGLALTIFKGYLRLARHTFSSVVSSFLWAMTNE